MSILANAEPIAAAIAAGAIPVTALTETAGPTVLVTGSIADGEYLKRAGTTLIGVDVQALLNAKQATLVSGTNIKTINGQALPGSGDLVVSASDPSYTPGSFTIATGTGRIFIKRMALTTTQRATIAGTARARLT